MKLYRIVVTSNNIGESEIEKVVYIYAPTQAIAFLFGYYNSLEDAVRDLNIKTFINIDKKVDREIENINDGGDMFVAVDEIETMPIPQKIDLDALINSNNIAYKKLGAILLAHEI